MTDLNAAPAASAADPRGQLIALLRDENATVRLLETTLRDEAEALLAGERERIDDAVTRKQHQINHLSGLDRERRMWWATHHPTADPYGLPRHMQADPDMAALFNDTIQRARQLQSANQLNGSVIDLRLRTTRETLAVLGSAAGAQQPYGPDGRQALNLPGFSVIAE